MYAYFTLMALDAPAHGKIQVKTEVSNKHFHESTKEAPRSPTNAQKMANPGLGYEDAETFQDVIASHKNFTRPKADMKSQLKVLISENKQLMNSNPYSGRPYLNEQGPSTDFLKANKNLVKLTPQARKQQKRQVFKSLKEKQQIAEDRRFMLEKANYQLKMLKSNSQ